MTAAQQPEIGTTKPMALELDHRREASTIALLDRQADLAQLTDEEFNRRIAQAQQGQRRLMRIFETLMIEGVHYNTKQKDGKRNAFPSPNLTQEGAEILRQAFRLTPIVIGEPAVVATPDFCEVTITYAILDMAGRQLAQRSAACNSKEPRFFERPRSKARDDQAAPGMDEAKPLPEPVDPQALKAERQSRPLYSDARETQHVCHAIAAKRAQALATADATGIRAFLKEKSRQALAQRLAPEAPPPWTQAEKEKVYAAAKRAGINTVKTLRTVVLETLGHEPPATGEDVQRVLAALATWTPEAQRQASGVTEPAVKDATESYGAAPAPAETTPAPAAPEPVLVAPADAPSLRFAQPVAPDDLALDQQLADEERRGK